MNSNTDLIASMAIPEIAPELRLPGHSYRSLVTMLTFWLGSSIDCSICLESLTGDICIISVRKCKHVFHYDCFKKVWKPLECPRSPLETDTAWVLVDPNTKENLPNVPRPCRIDPIGVMG